MLIKPTLYCRGNGFHNLRIAEFPEGVESSDAVGKMVSANIAECSESFREATGERDALSFSHRVPPLHRHQSLRILEATQKERELKATVRYAIMYCATVKVNTCIDVEAAVTNIYTS